MTNSSGTLEKSVTGFRQSIDEIRLFGITAHIHKGENDD